MRVDIKSEGIRQKLRATIRRLQPQGMHKAWNDVGEVVLRSINKNFDAEGRPEGWPARSEAYDARQRRRGKDKMLVDTGRLHKSITHKATWRYVDVGTSVIYAATHQFGDKERKIPARPFIAVQDEDWPVISDVLAEHIMKPFL